MDLDEVRDKYLDPPAAHLPDEVVATIGALVGEVEVYRAFIEWLEPKLEKIDGTVNLLFRARALADPRIDAIWELQRDHGIDPGRLVGLTPEVLRQIHEREHGGPVPGHTSPTVLEPAP